MKTMNVAIGLLLLFPGIVSAEIIFVDSSAAVTGGGQSWQDPLTTITQAIDQATSGDQIWVRGGIYIESFALKSGIQYYGGFAGTENSIEERDLLSSPTVIHSASVTTGSSIQVYNTTNILFDQFTVEGGQVGALDCQNIDNSNAITNCRLLNNGGQGLRCFVNAAPIAINCEMRGNGGAGVTSNNTSSPHVINCHIVENGIGPLSAGVFINTAAVTLENCLIEKNDPSGIVTILGVTQQTIIRNCIIRDHSSRGASLEGSPVLMENCYVLNNGGFAIFYEFGNAEFRNCFIANHPNSSGFSVFDAAPKIINCVIYNCRGGFSLNRNTESPLIMNTIVTNSEFYAIGETAADFAPDAFAFVENCLFFNNVLGLLNRDGEMFADLDELNTSDTFWMNNLSSDPLFQNPAANDFRIHFGSPAIDNGASSSTTGLSVPLFDIEAHSRPFDVPDLGGAGAAAYDIGAYEYQPANLLLDYLLGIATLDAAGAAALNFNNDASVDAADLIFLTTIP